MKAEKLKDKTIRDDLYILATGATQIDEVRNGAGKLIKRKVKHFEPNADALRLYLDWIDLNQNIDTDYLDEYAEDWKVLSGVIASQA